MLLVCTSKPWEYAERILERFKLTPYFKAVYGPELSETQSSKVELSRPAAPAGAPGGV